MEKRVRVGLLGCGRIAQLVHLKVLASTPGIEVVALAESDPQRLREAADRVPGAQTFSDYRELLSGSGAEAVVICLPPAPHADAAIAAFEAGKHVYLEKPMATTLDEGRAILEAARAAGTAGMMGFNYRFNPLLLRLKECLREKRLGEIAGVRSIFSSTPRAQPEWKRSRKTGGGALLDFGSHHLDLIPFLFDDVISEVSAFSQSRQMDDDSFAVQVRLSSGVTCQSLFMIGTVAEDRFEVYGEKGRITVDRYQAEIRFDESAGNGGNLARLREELGSFGRGLRRIANKADESSYPAAFSAFAEAAARGTQASPSLEDGYRSLLAIDAAERSAATGRSISLSGITEVAPALSP